MLDHYEIRGITNKCFKTYPKFRQQFVSINGYNSECSSMPVGVWQGSVLGPLLFLLYIKGLNLIIKHCKVTKVITADHTNLLYTNSSIKKLNEFVNKALRKLTSWLNANKLSITLT